MNWYLKVIKSAFDFNSRARRKEYWMYVIINWVIIGVLGVVEHLLGFSKSEDGYGFITGLYALVIFIPGLAVSVRRLHDINRSGWALLINLIPIIGQIILFIWMIKEGNQGENKYGPNPKNTANDIRFVG